MTKFARIPQFLAVTILGCAAALPQNAPRQSSASGGNLDSVLTRMDEAAAKFRSAEADLTSDQYEKVVNETDTQTGKAYFRRKNGNMQMALDIQKPDAKYVLVSDSKAQLYQPNIDQVTEYDINRSSEDVEGMFALGFGGRGHDLAKSFGVELGGAESVDGVTTAKLLLTPKQPKIKSMFNTITLWVDPARGVSLQQRFDEPSGDYRVAHYRNIKLNQKINDDVFKLKTTGATKVVKPQS
jgi:outer membrane lipoprotein-sorting protein